MSNVINLRQARKTKARAEKARQADANRAKYGRTKAQRASDAEEEKKRISILNGAKLDNDPNSPKSDQQLPPVSYVIS
ncbi:DUF4169 family protein [Sphingobium sp.]|uniref:DUF4169 family protein n=1 Tax=Sphingobium sp. TaxID=1912891 RepID=UPI00262091D7|nr:DUF4169 family protein [Sphingobium sp.]